jgi:hypothetical protein
MAELLVEHRPSGIIPRRNQVKTGPIQAQCIEKWYVCLHLFLPSALISSYPFLTPFRDEEPIQLCPSSFTHMCVILHYVLPVVVDLALVLLSKSHYVPSKVITCMHPITLAYMSE